MEHPIERIVWLEASELQANDYNPNVVYTPELKLLEYNIVRHGWIQPILVTQDKVIIDGFHRWKLTQDSEPVRNLTGGKVPCCVINLSEPERMMLTVRINRAKGAILLSRCTTWWSSWWKSTA